jgi:hypothetical protein
VLAHAAEVPARAAEVPVRTAEAFGGAAEATPVEPSRKRKRGFSTLR